MGNTLLGGDVRIDGLNRRYNSYEDRNKVIEKIREIRYKDAFKYYKQKFYIPSETPLVSDDVMKKLFTDFKFLDQVINTFVSYCPTLEIPTPEYTSKKNKKRNDTKLELLKEAISQIKWDELNTQIYDSLESEGDAFFYIYFEKQKDGDRFRIPKLRYLDSDKMRNIITDSTNSPLAYIYVDKEFDEIIDYSTGKVTKSNETEVTYIFEKGRVHKIERQSKTEGVALERNEEGKIEVSKTIDNLDFYKNIIPIIHIHSKKRQDEKFSIIPAEDYVEVCLQLSQIQSDIRATNRQLGFPRVTLLDCTYVEGDGRIGGVKVAKTMDDTSDDFGTKLQGKVIQHTSATNESFFKEEENVIDYLYNLVCITNPTLMNKVGSSDSSKVLQQVNARMEKKIELYINNIIQAFKPYFRILLLANKLYDEKTDADMSFKKPKSIIRNSVYDEALIDQLDLNNGLETIQSKLRDKGKSSEAIQNHMEELNEEISNGSNDIQYSKTPKQVTTASKNANGVQKNVAIEEE